VSDNGNPNTPEHRVKALPQRRCPHDGTLLFKSDGEYLEIPCRTCRRAGRHPLIVLQLRAEPVKAEPVKVE
jgi:hypothetical protein